MAFKTARVCAALGALALAGCAGPSLSRFEQALAVNPSATAALQGWCVAQRLAYPAQISAAPVVSNSRPEPPGLRNKLGTTATELLGYRHVRLSCGTAVLSEAHNWYVPARLTPAMNAALAGTDTPFGTVAAPLSFRRERLGSVRGASAECPAGTILSQRALLRLPDGQALALVAECYTAANLIRGG